MSDEQNTERGRRGFHKPADVEGHGAKANLRQDVEGQGFRWGKSDSEAPESSDVAEGGDPDQDEVEGQVIRVKQPISEVEAMAFGGERTTRERLRSRTSTQARRTRSEARR